MKSCEIKLMNFESTVKPPLGGVSLEIVLPESVACSLGKQEKTCSASQADDLTYIMQKKSSGCWTHSEMKERKARETHT